MIIRGVIAVVACVATIAIASTASAQDTMRTRDSMQMMRQMRQGMTMTTQARDSLIARLLDSANRAQDPMIAQRLRDSVATLRAGAGMSDSMSNRMNMQQQRVQTQPRSTQMQQQPTSVTSDQRVRMQKDGRPYQDGASSTTPPDSGSAR